MLLSIGIVRSTTRLNLSWTGCCANATEAAANASETKTSIRAFIMLDLPPCWRHAPFLSKLSASIADRTIISEAVDFVRHTDRSIGAMFAQGPGRAGMMVL